VKLLFLDINLRYINPTRALIPGMLRECADTSFYGPGYQRVEVLERGLQAFYDANGPFDFVIGNEHSIRLHRQFASGNYLQFGKASLALMDGIRDWFAAYRGKKIALLLESDMFNLRPEQISALKDAAAWYAVLWDRWLMESVKDSKDLEHEAYARQANDNFFDFITANERRVIAFPHFVADSEFAWGCLADRDARWNVPGVPYYYRRLAGQALAARGLLKRQFSWMRGYALLARLGLRPYSNGLLLSLYGTQFNLAIERTRYSYTCGSAQKMHIRKHFEIPARGAVLVTAPVHGLASLGFVDGVNCFVRTPRELVDLHEELERDPDRAQSVASAGRDVVWSTHRAEHRARQLRECLCAIERGRFAGCVWQDGRWAVQTA
jgi:hypothetical protein